MSLLRLVGRVWTGVLLATVVLTALLLSLRVVLPLAAPPPTVIASDPADGSQDVALRTTAVLHFSSPMNPRSVEQGLAISPPIRAAYVWDPAYTTLTISPTVTLRPSTRYTVTLDQQALSRMFRPIAEPLQLTFDTAPAPAVIATLPADGARDVPADSAISISFSRAIVPTDTLTLPSELPELRFAPPLTGTTTWLNPSLALFRPAAPLQGSTRYQATLDRGLTDLGGAALDQPFVWSFSTAAPRVLATTPTNGAQGVAPNAPLVLKLSQPIDTAALQAELTISPTMETDLQAALLPDATQLITVTPRASWNADTSYTVAVPDGIPSLTGNVPLEQGSTWHFRTAPLPRVIGRFPGEGQTLPPGQDIRLIFNTPIDAQALQAALRFSPAVDSVRVTTEENEAHVAANLQAATTYTMTLDAALQDRNGVPLGQAYQLRFVTAPAAPALLLAQAEEQVVRLPSSSTGLLITRTNLSALNIDLYELDEPTTVRLLDQARSSWAQFSPERYSRPLVRSRSVPIADPLNVPAAERLPLTDADDQPLPPGAYFVHMRTPEGPRADVLLLISELDLTWQASDTSVLALATESNTGTPVAGVQIALYRQGALVQRGSTDANGVWTGQTRAGRPASVLLASGTGITAVQVTPQSPNLLDAGRIRAFLTTDRSIYQPGQTVQIAGFVRAVGNQALRLPAAGLNGELHIRPVRAIDRIYETTVAISSTGRLTTSFTLPASATAGDYLAAVRLDDELFTTRFAVQAEPDSLQIAINVPDTMVAGETATAQLVARTSEGLPVADALISYTLQAEPAPATQIDGYQLGAAQPTTPAFERSGTATTDSAGRWALPLAEPTQRLQTLTRLRLTTTIAEPGGRPASSTAAFTVAPAGVLVGVRLPSRVLTIRQAQSLELATFAPDGTPAPGVDVRVEVFRRPSGSATDASSIMGERVLQHTITTDAAARATLPLTMTQGGAYRIVATATDGGGRQASTSALAWVAAQDFMAWSTRVGALQLIPDRDTYQPGDTALLLPTTPFETATALIGIQQANTLTGTARVLRAGDMLSVPIPSDAVQPVVVSMQLVEQRSAPDAAAHAAASAAVALPVVVDAQRLSLTLATDQQRYLPGATAQITITTTDASGRGVPADVVLGATERRAAPTTGTTFTFLGTSARPFEPASARLPAGGLPAPTAFWLPALRTDRSGVLTTSVTLPNEPRELLITAWAAQRDQAGRSLAGFGQAQQPLVVTQPLALDLELPDLLRVGDTIELVARLHNTSSDPQNTCVTLSSTGLRAADDLPTTQQLELAPGAMLPVRWQLRVEDVDGASLGVQVRSTGGLAASETISRTIAPLNAGILLAGSLLVEQQTTTTLSVPEAFTATAQLQIEAIPSVPALAHATQQTLAAQPARSVLDNAAMLLLEVRDGPGANQAQAAFDEQTALDDLLATQKLDGSWPWWPDGSSNTFVTAQALESLAAAQRIGLPVPSSAVNRGFAALRTTASEASPTLRAYIEYVRVLHRRGDAPARQQLAADPRALGPDGAAYLLLAGPTGEAREALLTYLVGTAQRDENAVFWQPAAVQDAPSTRVSTTALAALALQQPLSDDALLHGAARWLAETRGVGGWSDSLSSARAIAALRALRDDDPARNLTVQLNGTPLLALDASTPLTATQQATAAALQLRRQNTLSATSDGFGLVSYALRGPGAAQPSTQRRSGLLREYLDPQTGQPVDLTAVQVGQRLRVRLTFVTTQAQPFVMLEDWLPAGVQLVSAGSGDFEHIAAADGRLLLARTTLAPGIYEHSYLVRAGHPGSFAAPPAQITSFGATIVSASPAATLTIVAPR